MDAYRGREWTWDLLLVRLYQYYDETYGHIELWDTNRPERTYNPKEWKSSSSGRSNSGMEGDDEEPDGIDDQDRSAGDEDTTNSDISPGTLEVDGINQGKNTGDDADFIDLTGDDELERGGQYEFMDLTADSEMEDF